MNGQSYREKNERTTSYIKHLAVSGLSSVSARVKSTCNLTGKCFESQTFHIRDRYHSF